MELDLLFVLSNKTNFDRFERFVERKTVTKQTYQIITDMRDWYETHVDLNWENFATWFKVAKHPTYKAESIENYQRIFDRMIAYSPSGDEKEIIKALIARDYASRASEITLSVAEGEDRFELEAVTDLVNAYLEDVGKAAELDSKFVSGSVEELAEHVVGGTGYHWRLNEFNLGLGPIRKGDFIIMAAPVDTGKTTMLASEVTHIAGQMDNDDYILWVNNEEEGKKVKWRIMSAALGKSTSWMQDNLSEVRGLYEDAVGHYHKIRIIDDKTVSVKDIETLIKAKPPAMIIFDQLWKVFGFEKESVNEVDRQTKLFAWGRKLAGQYGPVITVHQADGSAAGCMYIEMGQLYGSRVGIQGEADAIVTLGRPEGDAYPPNTRGLYFPKNKLAGDGKTKEEYRNGKFEITIEHEIARFKGVY